MADLEGGEKTVKSAPRPTVPLLLFFTLLAWRSLDMPARAPATAGMLCAREIPPLFIGAQIVRTYNN